MTDMHTFSLIDGTPPVDRNQEALAALFDGVDEQEWQDNALCAQVDSDLFFPEKGGSTREAKRICQGCDVRAECLDYALSSDIHFGVWGGLSERERRKLQPAKGPAPAPYERLLPEAYDRRAVEVQARLAGGETVREIAAAMGLTKHAVHRASGRHVEGRDVA